MIDKTMNTYEISERYFDAIPDFVLKDYADSWIARIVNPHQTKEQVKTWLKTLMTNILQMKKIPRITVLDDPHALKSYCKNKNYEEGYNFDARSSYWLSYYMFLENGLKECLGFEIFKDLEKMVQNYDSFPWVAYEIHQDNKSIEIACIIHPIVYFTENDGLQLHCATGPAVAWRSGYKQYWVHGVYFTAEEFHRFFENTPDLKEVFEISNAEKRTAVMLENRKILINSEYAKLIDEDTEYSTVLRQSLPRRLYALTIPRMEPLNALEIYCHSTGDISIHLVKKECLTVKTAIAFLNRGIESFEIQT